ncbi:hypothetical protein ACSNOI_44055 [Actinomadura kijaniata]|uniref:hypothetical protein n=1 Tax=Actinomadura kijaniata TaxID=46161 RepID=UPI003F19C771
MTNTFTTLRAPGLRRLAHGFLRHHASQAWLQGHHDKEWEILTPPRLELEPVPKRFRIHARQEARRLADAELFEFSTQATDTIVRIGARLRERLHPQTVLVHGPGVVDTASILPPSPQGFVFWQDPNGVGYEPNGAPLIACHWGHLGHDAYWLAWWCDTYTGIKLARAEDGGAVKNQIGTLAYFGPLFYAMQNLLSPRAATPKITGRPARDNRGLDGGLRGSADDPGEGDDDSVIALLYTTLATWQALTAPSPEIQLTHHAPCDATVAADRAASLTPRPVTLATTADEGEPPACTT